MKALEHFRERMVQRNITVEDVETVLLKRELIETKKFLKKYNMWSTDRKWISATTPRGFITVVTDFNEKRLFTCYVN